MMVILYYLIISSIHSYSLFYLNNLLGINSFTKFKGNLSFYTYIFKIKIIINDILNTFVVLYLIYR